MTYYNLVHKFILMPLAMKILDAKAAVDQEWKKLETISAWQLEKVKSKKGLFSKHKETKKKVHFCYIDGYLSAQKKRGVRTQITEEKRQSRAPW